ncbi:MULTISPECIES: MarR family transcriptional regulator [unclassified Pseudoalteromonas]|uniref:MarR family winged helix-turn-helix transcriptional regulator n=1 Tax=Pseudoalteromonas TaxID=53246 RepID=UPI000C8B3641|nr:MULTISPECIES: MarR family transcriptional regulator [unclassified Pseudoalteromonas]MAD03836.1 MarR family transcriptional regulator [Pseudoalteromonas sp.]MCG9709112.1 MarR family transcriptional regulator [Pseudoalteromonas sp. Isolate3]NIZ04219.1 MarR family transcriptional regulator [Pseudoalteromonas sp. HF66]RZD20363.1 MarR family transcriptional regulator [Pseudoalteromonas sp. MEBiC 03485]URQ92759.1 MarR family transcriptional regulator [Pseudoalteromonas sp. SCSIO 43101]|tara:strand:- start:1930 stop:2355 length:426 start_codon:yes stop_codon:yes gene_type:complete
MSNNLSDNVCFTLYSATNALIRAFRPILEAYDLTYPQYIVMHSLWYNNQVSLKELSNDTHLDSGTLTPIVKRLETKGLLTRQVSSEDERKKVISLTEQGMQLKVDAEELTAKLMARSNMSLERIELLRELTLELHTDLTKD